MDASNQRTGCGSDGGLFSLRACSASSSSVLGNIPPRSVSVKTRVAWFLAETTLTLAFSRRRRRSSSAPTVSLAATSDDDEPTREDAKSYEHAGGDGFPDDIECQLVMTLPENATVCGYAVDVDGQLVEAVVVSKEKARTTFEVEMREKRGAAIAEQTTANIFTLRIYPFHKDTDRIVQVVFTQQLTTPLGRLSEEIAYTLPLCTVSKLHTFDFKASIVTPTPFISPPRTVLATASGLLAPTGVQVSPNEFECEYEMHNTAPPHTISIYVPMAMQHSNASEEVTSESCTEHLPRALTEAGESSTDDSDKVFFAFQAHFDVEGMVPQKSVSSVVILWDTSLSRAQCDTSKELAVIKSLSILSKTFIDIVLFSGSIISEFRTKCSDTTAILAYIQSKSVYNGGSNLLCACARANAAPPNSICLLFTDGMHNWIENEDYQGFTFSVPIFTLTASLQADFSYMKRVSARSGGLFFNLNNSCDPMSLILQPVTFYTGCTDAAGLPLSDTFPATPTPLSDVFKLAGRIPSPMEDMQLLLHFKTPKTGVVMTQTILVPRKPSFLTQGTVSRYWAQQHTEELTTFGDYEQNQAKILHLGRRYRFVTPETSLIVLEHLDQAISNYLLSLILTFNKYLKHHIEPPDSLPSVKREYLIQIAKQRVGFHLTSWE
ncbi:TonB-dependent receptor [Pelomyxa schiedti]|nr:TonB-dependent receptor [Pelomyxa schiedti]